MKHNKGFCCVKECSQPAYKKYMQRNLCWVHYLLFRADKTSNEQAFKIMMEQSK